MGRANLQAFVDYAGREAALRWHVEANFFPPLPPEIQAAIIAAFERYWHGEVTEGELWKLCKLANVNALYDYFGPLLNSTECEE